MKQIWKTVDGQIFEDQDAAWKHEASLEIRKDLKKIFERPDRWNSNDAVQIVNILILESDRLTELLSKLKRPKDSVVSDITITQQAEAMS